MSSTEFTIGLLDGSRNSSKVLKPPGGGSSDIFGLGPVEPIVNKHEKAVLRSVEKACPAPLRPDQDCARSTSQQKCHRNPITGEIKMIASDQNKEDKGPRGQCDQSVPIQTAPVQTSIRVCHPPGGRSSNIF